MGVLGCLQSPQIVAKISVPVGAAGFALVCCVKGAVLGAYIQDKLIVIKNPKATGCQALSILALLC